MKEKLANWAGRQVTVCNRAHDEGNDQEVQIHVLGMLEDHEEGFWYVRTAPEELGSFGVGFLEEMVMEVNTRPSGRGILIVIK